MKTISKTVIFLLISIPVIFLILIFFGKRNITTTHTDNHGNTITIFEKEGITIINPVGTQIGDLIFLSGGSTVDQVASNYGYNIVINGGYFGRSEQVTGQFYPAGYYLSGGIYYAKPELRHQFDPNLGHIVTFQHNSIDGKVVGHGLSFAQYNPGETINAMTGSESFNPSKDHKELITFSAGPLLISGNIITSGLNQDISHRNGAYKRTILVYISPNRDSEGKTYYVLFTQGVTLEQAAEKIISLQKFGTLMSGGITALNLDGGPSTAIYTTDPSIQTEANFNITEKLPLFIGIK